MTFINNANLLDGTSTTIGTLGMVSFVLTYINSARGRKIQGILLEDVIHAFFPYYKWILVINGCMACLGRFGCSVKNGMTGLLCLFGMLICLVYMLNMANTVVFTERKVRQITDRYIELIASQYSKKQLKGLENTNVTYFIKSVGSYMAQQYNDADFSISYLSRENELKNLIPLLRCDNIAPSSNTKAEAKSAVILFESGNSELLESNSDLDKFCHNCCVLRMPYTKWALQTINNEIRIACSFWHSVLDRTTGNEARARLACEVLCSEHSNNILVSGTLGAGLLMYLHSTNISDTDPKNQKGWNQSMDFLYFMYTIAKDVTAERNDILMSCNNYPFQHWLRKRCIELMLIMKGWATVEQCHSINKFETGNMTKTIETILDAEKHMDVKVIISDEMIRLFTYYSFILFGTSPLPVLPPALPYQKPRHFIRVNNTLHEIRDKYAI